MAERISDAEHAVMEVLWADAPLTANSVAEMLADSQSWSLPTVKTLLSRLLAKGALAAEAEGRRFLYRPISRDALVALCRHPFIQRGTQLL